MRRAAIATTMILALASCGSDGGGGDDDDAGMQPDAMTEADAPVADAAEADAAVDAAAPDAMVDSSSPSPDAMDVANTLESQWVWDQLLVPESAAQANEFGIDLDGDPQMRPDNALGSVIATLAAQGGGSPQDTSDEAVSRGDVIYLMHLEAGDWVDDANVSAWVYQGTNPVPDPCLDPGDVICGQHLDGDGVFDIDATVPDPDELTGSITAMRLAAGPGSVTVSAPLLPGLPPIELPLVGVRVEVTDTTASTLAGKLGGAIREEDINGTLLPGLADTFATTVAQDCDGTSPPCCDPGTTGETLIDLFDDDDDCAISVTELEQNSLIQALLAPDLDLFDAAGNFAPNSDGENDSLSLGVGFTAVPATFASP